MRTQAEIKAAQILDSKTCTNCHYGLPRIVKKQPVLKCFFTGDTVPPEMHSCCLWKREREI